MYIFTKLNIFFFLVQMCSSLAVAEEPNSSCFLLGRDKTYTPSGLSWVTPTASGVFSLAFGDYDSSYQSGSIIIKDADTGKQLKKTTYTASIGNGADGAPGIQISPDAKSVLYQRAEEPKDWVLESISGADIQTFKFPKNTFPAFSKDGKSLVIKKSDQVVGSFSTYIKNLETGKEFKIPEELQKFNFGGSKSSFDEKTIVGYNPEKGYYVKNIETGKITIIDTKDNPPNGAAAISPDGNKVVYRGDKKTTIKDLVTGKETYIANDHLPQSGSFSFLSDGNSIIIHNQMTPSSKAVVVDINSGIQTIFGDSSSYYNASSNSLISYSSQATGYSMRVLSLDDLFCPSKNLSIISAKQDCSGCTHDQGKDILPSIGNTEIEKLNFQNLCNAEFDKKSWDDFTPAIKDSSELSEENAIKFLNRFQKTDGFEIKKHLPIMLSILKSDLVKKESNLVAGALQTILVESPSLYKQLLNTHSLELANLHPTDFTCRTAKEKEKIKTEVMNYLKNMKTEHQKDLVFGNLQALIPFAPVLATLTPAQKEEWIDEFATMLSDHAAVDREFKDVYLSKLYKFSRQGVAPFFGEKALPITDLTIVKSSANVYTEISAGYGGAYSGGYYGPSKDMVPLILSAQPLELKSASATGNTSPKENNTYGFYSLKLDEIPATSTETKSLSWKTDGKEYKASVDVKLPESKNMIPEGSSPDYQSMLKDNVLTGVVFAGSNLGPGLSQNVMGQYLAYYQEQGFEFKDKTGTLDNFPKFLQEKTESGEMDYLIKEAHSDGDEKNITRISVKARYEEGVRTRSDGKKEKIYLVYPDATDNTTMLLPNGQFGEWMRKREASGGGQMAYMNTSCWSVTKAVHEIQAAKTPMLLDISSITMVQTFTNQPTSAEYQLLDSFRHEKNYSEIRTALENNKEYKNKTENYFVFPDEAAYKEKITAKVLGTAEVVVTIKDHEGKAYNLDQLGH